MDFNNIYRDLVSSGSTAEDLDRVLDKGLVYSSKSSDVYVGGGQSIASGETEAIYVLASVETYLKYAEVVGAGGGSVYASVETYLKYAEAVGGGAERESKFFLPTINKLGEITNGEAIDRISDKGIVESSWFRFSKDGVEVVANENEALGNFNLLSRLISDYSSGIISGQPFDEVVDRILDKGIVFDLSPYRTVVASVETYLKYAEAVG